MNTDGLERVYSEKLYEMAGYGSAQTWARPLGREEAANLLEETLEEEKKTDGELTEIAETLVNSDAGGTDEEEDDAEEEDLEEEEDEDVEDEDEDGMDEDEDEDIDEDEEEETESPETRNRDGGKSNAGDRNIGHGGRSLP